MNIEIVELENGKYTLRKKRTGIGKFLFGEYGYYYGVTDGSHDWNLKTPSEEFYHWSLEAARDQLKLVLGLNKKAPAVKRVAV